MCNHCRHRQHTDRRSPGTYISHTRRSDHRAQSERDHRAGNLSDPHVAQLCAHSQPHGGGRAPQQVCEYSCFLLLYVVYAFAHDVRNVFIVNLINHFLAQADAPNRIDRFQDSKMLRHQRLTSPGVLHEFVDTGGAILKQQQNPKSQAIPECPVQGCRLVNGLL